MRRLPLAVAVLCLFALALRLWHLQFQSLWWDEGVSIYLAGQGVRALTIDKDFGIDLHPPIYHLALGIWTLLLGPSVFSSRLLSVFGGVATVPLTIQFTLSVVRLAAEKSGSVGKNWPIVAAPFVAGLLATISPIDVFYSQESRMYPFLPVIGAASLIATARVLQVNRRRRWLIWVAINLIGVYVFYYLGFLALAESVVLLIGPVTGFASSGQKRWLWRWILAQAALILGFAPWALILLSRGRAASLALPAETEVHLTSWPFLVENWSAFTVGFSMPPFGNALLILWALVAVVGASSLARRSSGTAILCVVAALLPVVLAGLILLVRPFYYPRFVLFAVIPLWALVAIGVARIGDHRLFRVVYWLKPLRRVDGSAVFAAAIVLILLSGSAWTWYVERTTPRTGYAPDDYRAVFATMAERIETGDVIVGGYPWQAGYARAYFWQFSPRAIYVNPRGESSRLTNTIAAANRAWVLTYSPNRRFESDAIETTASKIYPTTFVDQNGDSRVRLFESRPPSAASPSSVATFASAIGLQSALGPSPATVEAGATVSEVLRWRALSAPAGDYTVFIHLIGPDGKLWGQVDSPPLRGFFPTHAWSAGMDLVDRYAVPVDPRAPPGHYDVEVGLYRPDNGQRLTVGPVPAADNRVIVGSFVVVWR